MTFLLYCTSMIFVWEVAQLNRDMRTFNSNMVWNIDAVRNRYISDAEFSFKRGCYIGTEYPPEYRNKGSGFNENSPTIYCNKEFTSKMEEYFLEQLPKLGVSEQ